MRLCRTRVEAGQEKRHNGEQGERKSHVSCVSRATGPWPEERRYRALAHSGGAASMQRRSVLSARAYETLSNMRSHAGTDDQTRFAPPTIATGELRGPDGKLLVDHLACGPGLAVSGVDVISNLDDRGGQSATIAE